MFFVRSVTHPKISSIEVRNASCKIIYKAYDASNIMCNKTLKFEKIGKSVDKYDGRLRYFYVTEVQEVNWYVSCIMLNTPLTHNSAVKCFYF